MPDPHPWAHWLVVSCVFCDIVAGKAPARWVAQQDLAVAFLPMPEQALAPGHVLVVPREHAVGVQDVSPQGLAAAALMVQQVARAADSALGASGVCVLNASGPGSGQTVHHLHFHVVPHWPDDEYYAWPGRSSDRPTPAGIDVAARLAVAVTGNPGPTVPVLTRPHAAT